LQERTNSGAGGEGEGIAEAAEVGHICTSLNWMLHGTHFWIEHGQSRGDRPADGSAWGCPCVSGGRAVPDVLGARLLRSRSPELRKWKEEDLLRPLPEGCASAARGLGYTPNITVTSSGLMTGILPVHKVARPVRTVLKPAEPHGGPRQEERWIGCSTPSPS